MELYVIRHGETDWNRQGRLQGREDIPLNEQGMRQADECGEALQGIAFQCVYTSPLCRARTTAERIASFQACGVRIDGDLIERDYGRLSGLLPEEREAYQSQGLPEEMESWEELAARVRAMAERYAAVGDPAGRYALVSHGAWINALLAVLSGHEIGTGKTRLTNACISILRLENQGWRILCYNISPQEFAERNKKKAGA